jgi:hypothetical protein
MWNVRRELKRPKETAMRLKSTLFNLEYTYLQVFLVSNLKTAGRYQISTMVMANTRTYRVIE